MATTRKSHSPTFKAKVAPEAIRQENTLAHWRSELEKALAWLEQARAWLERALSELQQAINEFNSAKEALEMAIYRFERCRNTYRTDSRGNRIYNNCPSEAREVQYAEYRLNEARENVKRF